MMYKCPNCGVTASITALRKLTAKVPNISPEELASYSDRELLYRICWCCGKEVEFTESD